jgi:RNA polymerase sigma factor (sigma-70 family)
MVPEDVLIGSLPLIHATVARLGAKHRLAVEDIEDFVSDLYLGLVENDYAALRAFRGHSKLSTFLTAVVRNQFHKWIQRNGRALELREVSSVPRAVELTEEAVIEASTRALQTPEDLARVRRLARALQLAMAALPPASRLLLELYFWEGWSVPRIAQAAGADKFRLYRRMRGSLRELRAHLELAGVEAQEALVDPLRETVSRGNHRPPRNFTSPRVLSSVESIGCLGTGPEERCCRDETGR